MVAVGNRLCVRLDLLLGFFLLLAMPLLSFALSLPQLLQGLSVFIPEGIQLLLVMLFLLQCLPN
ncbi:hypothetical protein D3C80_2193140 [compost metagenome]